MNQANTVSFNGQATIKGIVRTIFRNPINGWTVIKVRTPDDYEITACGNLSAVRDGDQYEMSGEWIKHPKFGDQFKFDTAEVILPQSKPGIVSYIADIAFGVGRKRAGAIYDQLGDNCLEVIAAEGPGALMGIPGITPSQAEEIHAKLTQNQTLAEIASMVCGEGVGPSLAHRIYALYGKEAVAKIRENPFCLAEEMFGVGFKTADKIARHVGVAVDSPYRVQAAYKYILKTAAEDGNCFLKPGQTIPGYEMVESGGKSRRRENIAAQVLGFTAEIGTEQIRDASLELIRREECVRETDPENGSRIYLKGMYEAETALAGDILRLLRQGQGEQKDRGYIEALIDDYQNRTSMEFAPEQRQAIVAAMQSRLSVLTGGPGTGKTASINAIISAYEVIHPTHKIYLASPTGRAAKRMSECTGGREAKTIHRLLRYNPHEGGFQHNRYCQLEGPGLLILDEVSMCDTPLAANLFEAIPDSMTVVLVGDEDQLPSVGPGKVLGDIIRSGVVPVTRLSRIFRQADGSGIAALAHQIRAGEGMGFCLDDVAFCRADGAAEAADVAVQQAIQAVEEYGLMGFQLLTPQRRGPAGVDALNERLQEVLNPAEFGKPELKAGRVFRVGDKAMVIKNNYKKGVFNGDMGMVTGVGEGVTADGTKEQGIYVEIDGGGVFFGRSEIDQLMLAYAGTVHRCLSLDTLIETDQGLIRIGRAGTGYAGTIDGVKEFVRTPNLPEKEMLQITTEDGYRITVTPDHGIDAWDGQQYSRFKAQDLKTGNWLQIGLGVRIEPKRNPELPMPTNGDIREKKYKVPSEMTVDLAEFIGLMVADGTNFGKGFRLGKNHKEVTDRFADLCVKLFGCEPRRYEGHNIYFAEVCSVYLSRWLSELGGMEPNQKAVPGCVLAGTSEHHKAFLRGLFEDGSVNLRTNNPDIVDHIEYITYQERIAADVQVMLARLGIVSSHVRNSGKHGYSRIYLYGEYARMFGEAIGFITPEKQRRAILPAGRQVNYLIPVSKEEATKLFRQNTSFSEHDRCNARSRGHISRNKFNEFTNVPELLRARAASHHSRIVSIDKVTEESTCLNVPDGHRFLQNAISGWNSQGGEWPHVIFVCVTQHFILLQRNLAYTAVTRAKKYLTVVGQEKAVSIAVNNNKINERNTWLAERLRGGG